jgi:hypothetical protein
MPINQGKFLSGGRFADVTSSWSFPGTAREFHFENGSTYFAVDNSRMCRISSQMFKAVSSNYF